MTKLPKTSSIVWILVFSMVGAAMYQADVLGVRSKVLSKVFPAA